MLSFLIQNEIVRSKADELSPKKKALASGRHLGPIASRAKADAKYIALLKDGPLLTSVIASRLGYSHMGCLSSLYSLEERKIVKRINAHKAGMSSNVRALAWELV